MADADCNHVEASMGHSVYTMSEYASPGMLRLTRTSAIPDGEGVKSFYIPKELVLRFVAERLRVALLSLLGGEL